MKGCAIQGREGRKAFETVLQAMRKTTFPPYNKETHEGFLRHCIIREAMGKGRKAQSTQWTCYRYFCFVGWLTVCFVRRLFHIFRESVWLFRLSEWVTVVVFAYGSSFCAFMYFIAQVYCFACKLCGGSSPAMTFQQYSFYRLFSSSRFECFLSTLSFVLFFSELTSNKDDREVMVDIVTKRPRSATEEQEFLATMEDVAKGFDLTVKALYWSINDSKSGEERKNASEREKREEEGAEGDWQKEKGETRERTTERELFCSVIQFCGYIINVEKTKQKNKQTKQTRLWRTRRDSLAAKEPSQRDAVENRSEFLRNLSSRRTPNRWVLLFRRVELDHSPFLAKK